ncbi:MAG: flagellar biosynthesis anti-sigma factor FlgM [Bacillota bacterium]
MKVNNYGNIQEIMKAYINRKKDSPGTRRDAPVSGSGDTLEISAQARELQEAKAALKDVREVREEKVEELKRQIASGAYKADAGKIAEGIVRERLLDKHI